MSPAPHMQPGGHIWPLAQPKNVQKSLTVPPSAAAPHVLNVLSGLWQSASGEALHAAVPQQNAKRSGEHLPLKQALPSVGQSHAVWHSPLPSAEASGDPPPVPVPAVPPPVVALPPEPPFPPPVVVVPEPPEPALPLVVLLLSSLEHPKSTGKTHIPITATYRERIRSPLG
jgi:hypothetical protein